MHSHRTSHPRYYQRAGAAPSVAGRDPGPVNLRAAGLARRHAGGSLPLTHRLAAARRGASPGGTGGIVGPQQRAQALRARGPKSASRPATAPG